MNNQKLTIVRGTTNAFGITVTDEKTGEPVVLEADQVLVFGIKKRPEDREKLLLKKITNSADGEYYLELALGDTSYLDPGDYYYDVGLQQGTTVFYNVIKASPLKIEPNITELGDGS